MTVKELKKALDNIDENKIIQLGVQGYTTKDDPAEEYIINIEETENNLFIFDQCYYEKR